MNDERCQRTPNRQGTGALLDLTRTLFRKRIKRALVASQDSLKIGLRISTAVTKPALPVTGPGEDRPLPMLLTPMDSPEGHEFGKPAFRVLLLLLAKAHVSPNVWSS